MAQLIRNLPAMWESWVRSQGWEDSPGEGKGYPLQYSGLENSKESDTTEQLFIFHALPAFSFSSLLSAGSHSSDNYVGGLGYM